MSADSKPYNGRILVIRGGAIGDFILTLPAIAALRRKFPDAYLEVLGYPHIIQLAVSGGLVDHAQSIEARQLAGFFARNGELAEELKDYFTDFDLIISYLYDPDEIFKTNVLRCTPAQFIAGSHHPEQVAGLHASKVFLKPLEQLAIFDADPVPKLQIGGRKNIGDPSSQSGSIGREQERGSAPALALHPGSGSERKNWSESLWAELLERLINVTSFDLLLVGGEAEGERLQRLAAALPPVRSRVAQSLPLTELAALLSQCEAFVGHDSGISHLAAALGLRGVLLWGDTREEVWRPPSRKMIVVRHPAGLNHLPLETVLPHVLELWPTSQTVGD